MEKLVFTLCSNNYLPYAAVLGDSLKKFNPEIRFVIGLVDQIDDLVDYQKFSDFEILPCFEFGYLEFDDMLSRYNIIEFNTAVKPFYFEYLFQKNPEIDRIYYIDPDILLYQPLSYLESAWGNASVLLTPNLTHLPGKTVSGELASLRHGLSNLGFVGIARSKEGMQLVAWWKERLTHYCKIDKCNGIFVDQKWMDIALLFFDTISWVKHPGWNMAWWNLSERNLLKVDNTYVVNSVETPLVFFHFSGFKPGMNSMTERLKSDEYDMDNSGPLRELFDSYETLIRNRNFEYLSKLKPKLDFRKAPNSFRNRIGRKVKSKMTNVIFRIFGV